MKKLLFIIIAMAACTNLYGQQIDQSNRYRSYDVLEKKQVTAKGFDMNGSENRPLTHIAQYLINQGIKVKTVLHLSADEGDEFSTPKEPYTIQFSYDKDWITGNHFINGSDIQIINKMYNGVDGSWQYVHGQTNNRSVFDLIEKALRENDSEKDKIIYSY